MAGYVKQGPWSQGQPFSADQATAMDIGIALAATLSYVDLGGKSGTVTLDAGVAAVYALTLTGDATISLTNMHLADRLGMVTLLLTAAGNTVTWDTSVVFESGAPSLTGAPDVIEFRGMPGDTSDYATLVGTY